MAKSKLTQTRLVTRSSSTSSSSATPHKTKTRPNKTPQKRQIRLTQAFSSLTSSGKSTATTKPKQVLLGKEKPNHSILNFFQKAPRPEDEELFVGKGNDCTLLEDEEDEEPQTGAAYLDVGVRDNGEGYEEDIYGATPPQQISHADEGETERFNEAGGPVKRRRLNSEDGNLLESRTEAQSAHEKARDKESLIKKKMKRPGMPFLEDSSSEDEDEKQNSNLRVRSHESSFTVGECISIKDLGPGELTNGTRLDREVPFVWHETPMDEKLGNNEGYDDIPGRAEGRLANPDSDAYMNEEFTGEELEAMRYMEEQARFEMEEDGEDSGIDENDAMEECCPVCNGSLAGASVDEATAHVNSCLDGNPTPLPQPKSGVAIDGINIGSRSVKAAIPRQGQPNPIILDDNIVGGRSSSSSSAFAKLMSSHAEDRAWATAAAAEHASRGLPAYKRTCPFYKIMPGFSICVDAFRYGAVKGCKAYFLSHFHSDHYMGLTANWTHGPIYCSKVTGSLVKSQLRTAAKYVVELEFNTTVAVPDTDGVTVTMIPANHCPGSSMFLFEKILSGGRVQRILHCGDFRACPAHVEHPLLKPETVDAISSRTKQQKIDVCYLDTTYLNPRYSFPPQSDVIRACAELCAMLNKSITANDHSVWDGLLHRGRMGHQPGIESVSKFLTVSSSFSSSSSNQKSGSPSTNALTFLGQPRNRLLVVCGTYSIGKERICVGIAQALQTKIYAAPAKLRMCRQLDDPELTALLTSDPREAQVHMHALMDINADTLAQYLQGFKGHFSKIVGFRPSGWNFRPSVSKSAPKNLANLPPNSLPTTQLLHSPQWRPQITARDLVPQRGGNATEAMCFAVPYSEHSSFRELALFLMALQIEKVVPTVNVGNETSRKRMRGWIDRWIAERKRGGLVRVLHERNGNGEDKERLWDGKDGKGGAVFW